MLPYPMRQARRALIRRALAGPIAVAPQPAVRTPRPTVDQMAAIAKRQAITADTFRHLNTPEASERLRSWQKTLPSARR
ncbi:hypothetical protein [uncultured Sphingomonas sp.]|uniref:hypothetical protein n=1 Tax=uncultured Sphingomonas sp. TaxID=158754 RepID=UPI0025FF55C8|nr:hypothetical protein [uncultured Sphingomonas sp.]